MTLSGGQAATVATFGFIGGAAAGWAAGSFWHSSQVASEEGKIPTRSAMAVPAALSHEPRLPAGSTDAGTSPQMSPAALCAAALSLQAALLARAEGKDGGPSDAELRGDLKALKQQLAQDESQIAKLTGRALTEPPNLPERFRQPAFLPALSAALAQAAPGAEITSVDCLEYPCISYGPSLTSEQMEALKGAVAKQGYGKDSFSVLALPGLTGFILMPQDDPNGATTKGAVDGFNRMLYRLEQMWDSTQGP
jgi:hypothetical protein